MIELKQVSNGYVVSGFSGGGTEVYTSLDDVFRRLLLFFEGRGPEFVGSNYGDVQIVRVREEESHA